MKEKALDNIDEPDTKLKRFRASDSLMRFLEALWLCEVAIDLCCLPLPGLGDADFPGLYIVKLLHRT